MPNIVEMLCDDRIAGTVRWDDVRKSWRCYTREAGVMVWYDELVPALKVMYPVMKKDTDVVLFKHQNGSIQIIEDHADLMATVLRFS